MRAASRWSFVPFVIALCSTACGGEDEQAGAVAAPPAVVVATLESRRVVLYRDFVARTEATETVEVQARVEAVLLTKEFEEGRRVKTGDVLYRLDPRTYEANLAAAEASVARAGADLKLAEEQVSVRAAEAGLAQADARLVKAEQDVARLRPLAERDAVPRQDLDTALASREVSKAEVEAADANLVNSRIVEQVGVLQAKAELQSARAQLALAQLDLEYCTITSPLDGLIGRTQINVGNLVGRGQPTALVTVSRVDPMYVTFSISEAEFLNLQREIVAGLDALEPSEEERVNATGKVEVELVLADDSIYSWKGHIHAIDRALALETGTLQIVTVFPNPDGLLRPGQFGRARIPGESIEGGVLVPQRAVQQQLSARVVLVVGDDDVVSLRSVTVGERWEDYYIVTNGVKAGDRVIVEGHLKARPGLPVKPTSKPISSEPEAEGGRGDGAGQEG